MKTRLFSTLLLLNLALCLPAMAIDCVNVTTYGATPIDNGGDDTAAINEAFNHGQCLYFPAGTYNYSGSMILMGILEDKSFRLYGDGPGVSKIIFTNTTASGGINAPHLKTHTLEIEGLTLQAGRNNSGTAISAVFNEDGTQGGSTDKIRTASIHNVQIIQTDGGFWNGGIHLERANNAVIDKVEITGLIGNQARGDEPGTDFGIQWVSTGSYKTTGLQMSNLMIWNVVSAFQTDGSVEEVFLSGFEFAFCGSYGKPVVDLNSSASNLGSAFHIVNGHVAALQQGMKLTGLRGAKVSNVLFLHISGGYADPCCDENGEPSGCSPSPSCNRFPWGQSGDDLALNHCTDAAILDNSFGGVGDDIVDENGIVLNDSHSVQITGNYFMHFYATNPEDACIRALSGSNSDKIRITNNVFESGPNIPSGFEGSYRTYGSSGWSVDGGYGGVRRAYNLRVAPDTYYRGNTEPPE